MVWDARGGVNERGTGFRPVPRAAMMVAMPTARLALLLLIAWPTTAAQADVRDRVDPTVHFQTIDNFAASDAWTMQRVGTWSAASKAKVADLLFSTDRGIGLSGWRFNVGGGINHASITDPIHTVETFEVARGQYDWHRQAPEQWFLTAARARGVDQFVAFANSPPGRMTRTGLTNSADDRASPTNLKPGFEGQYAAYLADVLAHFRDDGVPGDPAARIDFRYVSPVNEPDVEWNGGKQEGNRADNDTIRRIIVALRDELRRHRLHTQVLTPEATRAADMLGPDRAFERAYHAAYGDYINYFTAQPDLADVLGRTLCHHLYGSAAGPGLRRATDALGERMRQHPDWKIWMSEICIMEPHRDLGITAGLQLAHIVHACMAREGASAWQWWLAMSNVDYKDGLLYTDWHRPGDAETVIESKMLWALGNYSRFVRPGFVRVALTGDSAVAERAPLGTAYLDPRTGRLVVVYVNDGPTQRVALDLGPAARRVTTYTTSDTQSLAPQTVTGPIELPPRSVVTVVADPA